MTTACLVSGVAVMLLLATSRALWLAPSIAGWAMYLANVVLETVQKKSRIARVTFEALLALSGCALIGVGSDSVAVAALFAVGHLLLVTENLLRERRIVHGAIGMPEAHGLRRRGVVGKRFPAPCLHPMLALRLDGPLVARMPSLELGLVQPDRPLALRLHVGNHSRVPLQEPVTVRIDAHAGWSVDGGAEHVLPRLASGQVATLDLAVHARPGPRGRALCIEVTSGRFRQSLGVACDGCRRILPGEVVEACVRRYPGGRRGAFSLRGDFDLYDEPSLQSIDGLEDAFGLTARFAMAQTMYLSTRLSLDRAAAASWASQLGVDRGADCIPSFIAWLRESVDFRLEAPYPVRTRKRFVVEVGNHGHLHYDTDASGDLGNGWRPGVKPGQGRYAWQGPDTSSFGDQRDNILEARRWCERELGFTPRSWAKPGRGNDRFSPAAVEAAGCDVATGSDIGPEDNVLRQAPPHHPAGTRIVELTARYPSDPQHVQHAAMLDFWLHRGHRLARPVVVLVHQHMRQFDGIACSRMTERLLDRAVRRFNGDLHIDTVYGIGRYWLDVLSPVTGVVQVTTGPDGVELRNSSDRTIREMPVDIRLRDGSRVTRIIDLPPGCTRLAL